MESVQILKDSYLVKSGVSTHVEIKVNYVNFLAIYFYRTWETLLARGGLDVMDLTENFGNFVQDFFTVHAQKLVGSWRLSLSIGWNILGLGLKLGEKCGVSVG